MWRKTLGAGAETGYRLLESMRITTRNRHHGSRIMCMAMTIMLFNSWILVDALMRLDCKAQGTRTMIRPYSAVHRAGADDEEGPGPSETTVILPSRQASR